MIKIKMDNKIIDYVEMRRKKGLSAMEIVSKTIVTSLLVNYAKAHAPWQDRTGDARAKLDGSSRREGDTTFVNTLQHGVPYGVYLERANTGRFAILAPTVIAMFPTIIGEYKKAWRK